MLIDFCFSASFSAMGGAGVCGIEFLWIYLAGIVDICIGRATRLVMACGVESPAPLMAQVLYGLNSDVSYMEQGKLRRDLVTRSYITDCLYGLTATAYDQFGDVMPDVNIYAIGGIQQ